MRKRVKCVKLLAGALLSLFLFFVFVPMEAYATQDTEINTTTSFSVTANMSYLAFSGNSQATSGQDYTATIAMNGGCQMPSAITVTVGGVQLSEGSSAYTYNLRTGQITIKGEAITGNIVISAAATVHQFGSDYVVTSGPSCTGSGSQSKYCQVCGLTTASTGINATGHKFVNYVSNNDATCSKDGTKTATCSNAGCTATSTITDTGSRLSHTSTGERVNEVTETCMQEGYTGDLVCECGAVIKSGEVIPVTGHSEVIIDAQSPSCNIEGYTGDTICRYCDTIIQKGAVIPAIEEHSYGEWTTVLEATTLKIGRRERICTMCGMKESELIQASKWGGFILPVCIGALILVGVAGVGFGVYHAVKRINYIPNPLENRTGENAADDLEKTQADALVGTTERNMEENL